MPVPQGIHPEADKSENFLPTQKYEEAIVPFTCIFEDYRRVATLAERGGFTGRGSIQSQTSRVFSTVS